MIHEDDRRVLESYPEAKLITAKKDTVIGRHYHKIKTERFILSSGSCELITDGVSHMMTIGKLYTVEPNVFHEFRIAKDSVLIGLNSHPYDPNDDFKD